MKVYQNGKDYSSKKELISRKNFLNLFNNSPIPDKELIQNLGLFIKRQDFMRILFINELYKKIIGVHGVIMEFGVLWGQNLALFTNLRGVYEPYNHNRKIIGFDTFRGFPSVHSKNGKSVIKGEMTTTKGYENYLIKILDYHESENPISHIKKYEVVKGDAIKTLKKYLKDHPETIIALAYFDFDLYEPTKICLELIKPHLTKGSVLAFDQLNVSTYPGETIALKEVLGLGNVSIIRSIYGSTQSYLVIK